jgi:hypothetical protein
MPGSHADEIVGDYFDPDDWAEKLMDDTETEPDLDLPPLPPPRPQAAGQRIRIRLPLRGSHDDSNPIWCRSGLQQPARAKPAPAREATLSRLGALA